MSEIHDKIDKVRVLTEEALRVELATARETIANQVIQLRESADAYTKSLGFNQRIIAHLEKKVEAGRALREWWRVSVPKPYPGEEKLSYLTRFVDSLHAEFQPLLEAFDALGMKQPK